MIDMKKLKQLVELMSTHDLTEMDLQDEAERISLKRGSDQQPTIQYVSPPAAHAAPPPAPAAAPAPGDAAADTPPAAETGPTINSPMVGTFYAAPSPDAKPFVNVGDTVDADSVVCIVEAMKVFNEIKAETAGTIEKILVENGQAVEYGQPLFVVKPA